MTVWYSDHIGADGDNDTSLPAIATVSPAGIKHGRIRYSRAEFTGMPLQTTPDVVRMLTMKSSDRLLELFISTDGGSDAGAVDVGIHLAGDAHDGAALDVDLFGSAVTISTAIDRTDAWTESTTLDGTDRGLQLWQQAAVGAGTDTVDPRVLYDISLTVTTSFTTADTEIVLEAYYTAGD